MHLNKPALIILILRATILCTYFPNFLWSRAETISYGALHPSCSNKSFDCGSVKYISYPFWGGGLPLFCRSDPVFEIICRAGVPILNISSLLYIVQEINFTNYTLRVAREDLFYNTCPQNLRNTTIDPIHFHYPPSSTDQYVTLYYGCTADHGSSQLETLPNKFSCIGITGLYKTGDASSGPGPNITCNSNILVPINQGSAQFLEHPTEDSTISLQTALDTGFSIQWFYPARRSASRSARPCNYQNACRRSINRRISTAPSPPPSPEDYPGSAPPVERGSNAPSGNGMPVVQGPSYPPEILSYYHRTGRSPARVIVIVVPISITAVIIAFVTISCFLKRRHSATVPHKECNQYVEKFLLQNGSLAPKRYKYSEIKKMTKSFSDKLGKGGYGSVYKGMLPDGQPIAVKVLFETDSNGEEFINEVVSISKTSHVNIVSLLGFCYEKAKRALVYEFMPNKSLDNFLNDVHINCCLVLEKLYKIALGTAKGLEYLHTGCSTRIVHFDIKPQNILLDEDLCPKISDFGLAKLCKKKQSILSVFGTRGTIGYIAPELFSRNFGGPSHKSDVSSYGMMILEMVGARKVNDTGVIQSSENYFPDRIYEQVMLDVSNNLDGLDIQEEEEIKRKMSLIGFWCIQTIPSDRPSMSKVVEMLEGSQQTIQIPPKPFLFTPNLPLQEISSSFPEHVDTEDSAQD